jgi:hypothetical protein
MAWRFDLMGNWLGSKTPHGVADAAMLLAVLPNKYRGLVNCRLATTREYWYRKWQSKTLIHTGRCAVALQLAREWGVSTKKNLPPEGAAGCKIEGWGLLERSPLERPALSLIARGRQRTQAADWIKLLTEQDVKIAGRCKLRARGRI